MNITRSYFTTIEAESKDEARRKLIAGQTLDGEHWQKYRRDRIEFSVINSSSTEEAAEVDA